jgi:16S rRNA (uracil1498-N3)-methyltransferase
MPYNRFFLDTRFQPELEVLLDNEEAHHLSRVIRKQRGDRIELVNGKFQLATATILNTEKKGVSLRLLAVIEQQPPPYSRIICQALPLFNRLETIVEKGTELGMTALWLFPGQLSAKKEISHAQLLRLRNIAIASMKQSGRLDLPSILLHPPLEKWIPCPQGSAYYGDPHATAPFRPSAGNILFFVGPEAGFAPAEIIELRRLQANSVRLHANTLRTDTASLAALALAHSYA